MAVSRNITSPVHGNTISRDQVLVSQNLSKMMSATADAAGEAMPKITRRGMMAAMAAMTAVTAPTVALAAPIITPPATNLPIEVAENPELIAAHDRFIQACAEVVAAKEALEWLGDEWRHLWPLAPEELLGGANADKRVSEVYPPERDLIGRSIFRDTSELMKRMSASQRRKGEKLCFSVETSQQCEARIERWKQSTPKGRTAKSLERNIARHKEWLKEYEHAAVVARQYEAETARLRAESGVEEAKQRIAVANKAVFGASADISNAPAFTVVGLRIKAEALKTTGSGLFDIPLKDGIFGEVSRFIDAALNLHSVTA